MNKTVQTAVLLFISLLSLVYFCVRAGIDMDEDQVKALQLLIKIAFSVSVYCIVASELTKNYSQVDRLWSIMPVVYAWTMTAIDQFGWRSLILAILVSLWGIRLTLNFGIKGGYDWLPWKGEEDYRWAYLRREGPLSHPWIWRLFNIFFISFYQMALILLFTIPSILTINASDMPFNIWDALVIFGFLFFLSIETIADIQQYKFQKEKYYRINHNIPLGPEHSAGFIQSGLWAYMRHPNYMAEQMIWLMVYLMGALASGLAVNWTIGGFVLLALLFKGSSDFSEQISTTKYPLYKEYQKKVGRFFPKLQF